MNEIQIFHSAQFGQVRTVIKDDQPWFVASDVCKALELDKTWNALQRLDADEKGTTSISTPGGKQDMSIINEPGLYALVLGSRKPEAHAFKRWITHEVLPDIRKRGMYATGGFVEKAINDPDSMIQMLREYKAEKERREALEYQMLLDAPKVLFAESVEGSRQNILIGELAKLLKQNGVNIGQNRLFERLRKEGYLCSAPGMYNIPTQRSMEMKLFEIKERTVLNPDGSNRLTRTPMVTGKCQIYFINHFLKKEGN